MSVHTRMRRIKLRRAAASTKIKRKIRATPNTSKSAHWREVFKDELKKYGETGLMLRGCRLKAELTQVELGEAIGVAQKHISEMENGKRSIGKGMAMRFAKFFKTDYRKFL
jgi:DNA-binding XRE family transcriptional regulator